MKQGQRLRLDDVLFACEATRGNITEAAERLGVFRQSLHRYLAKTPRAQEAFTQWRQKLIDLAEQKLWDCVMESQPWAVALVLKTQGKTRGWSEKLDVIDTADAVTKIALEWDMTPSQVLNEAERFLRGERDGVHIYLPQKAGEEARQRMHAKLEKMGERLEHSAPDTEPPPSPPARPRSAIDVTQLTAQLPALVQAQDVAGVIQVVMAMLEEMEDDDPQRETEAGISGDC